MEMSTCCPDGNVRICILSGVKNSNSECSVRQRKVEEKVSRRCLRPMGCWLRISFIGIPVQAVNAKIVIKMLIFFICFFW